MVRLHDYKAREAKAIGFRTIGEAKRHLLPRIPNWKELTLPEFIDEMRRQAILRDEEIDRDRLARLGQRRLGPETLSRVPGFDASRTGQVYRAVHLADRHPNRYRPKFMQIHSDNIWNGDPGQLPGGMSSDDSRRVRTALRKQRLYSRIVVTAAEERAYREELLGAMGDFRDRAPDLHVHEQTLQDHQDLGLLYDINAYVHDFSEHFMRYVDKGFDETQYEDDEGKPLKCVIACIIYQAADYLGIRLRDKLVRQYNRELVTPTVLEEIAREFGLHILVFDLQCKKWCDYDFPPLNARERGNTVSIIVRGNHAYNVDPKYRGRGYIEDGLNYDPVVRGAVQRKTPAREVYGHFEIGDGGTITLHPDPATLEDGAKAAYYGIPDGDRVLEALAIRGVFPHVVGFEDHYLSFNFVLETPFRVEVQLRNVGFRDRVRKYWNRVPLDYTYTPGSVSMYLFRCHLGERHLAKIVDPVCTAVFKDLCRPSIWVSPCDVRKRHCYVLDINKAYYSFSGDVGVFERAEIVPVPPEMQAEWAPFGGIFRDEVGVWHHGEDVPPGAKLELAIRYDARTDLIREYGDSLFRGDTAIGEVDQPKDMFNLLVGKLNPRLDEKVRCEMISNLGDLSRFVMNPDVTPVSVHPIAGRGYLLRFVPASGNYSGSNLPHVAAQIIGRCRRQIASTGEILRSAGATVVGSMTDSLIFHSSEPIDFEGLGIGVGKDGVWKVEERQNLFAVGPGRYALYDDPGDEDRTILKFSGRPEGYLYNIWDLMRLGREHREGAEGETGLAGPGETDDLVHNRRPHMLVIGEAGVGKSRWIREQFSNEGLYLRLSPTGVSACSIDATTICSYFRLGHRGDIEPLVAFGRIPKARRAQIREIGTIVVDECWTASRELMEKVDWLLRLVCNSHLPFGNKRLVLVGDDRQLSSVAEGFMGSPLQTGLNAGMTVLPYEEGTSRLEGAWREALAPLRDPDGPPVGQIMGRLAGLTRKRPITGAHTVFYTNAEVLEHNRRMTERHRGKKWIRQEEDGTETPFKTGMPIMLRRNKEVQEGIYNGKICKFISWEGGILTMEYHNPREDRTITKKSSYRWFDPAFATTIHKVQGLTLPHINVHIRPQYLLMPDARKLVYVALSRVASGDRVYINIG